MGVDQLLHLGLVDVFEGGQTCDQSQIVLLQGEGIAPNSYYVEVLKAFGYLDKLIQLFYQIMAEIQNLKVRKVSSYLLDVLKSKPIFYQTQSLQILMPPKIMDLIERSLDLDKRLRQVLKDGYFVGHDVQILEVNKLEHHRIDNPDFHLDQHQIAVKLVEKAEMAVIGVVALL